MKVKEFKVKTKVYSIKSTELEMLIIYRMMILRLAKHLSGKETAFLMGKPLDYIDKIETFKIKKIYAHDLYIFSQVLDFENAGSAYPIVIKSTTEKNNYQMEVTSCVEGVTYELKQCDRNNVSIKTIFLLLDTSNVEMTYVSDEENFTKLKSTLQNLFEEGYFREERLAYEILYTCNERLDTYIKPQKLMEILQSYLGGKESFYLVQEESIRRNFSGFAYIEKSDLC